MFRRPTTRCGGRAFGSNCTIMEFPDGCFDVIRAMYSRVLRSLIINGQLNEEFETEAGVPQGAVLSGPRSCTQYTVYINCLHIVKALSDVGLGIWVLGRRVPLLLYADYIVLRAQSGRCVSMCKLWKGARPSVRVTEGPGGSGPQEK
jgi:hypothetical protein